MGSCHYCLRAPAREIRLLDLVSTTASGDLQGRVRRFSASDKPSFVSVSHVWGEAKSARPMYLESGCGTKTVRISSNLESFLIGVLCHDANSLPQLWEDGSRLPMWIDMICINQVDAEEKASQIPLMRDIYSLARSVLIWIHEYDQYIRYAFYYLRQLLEKTENGQVDESRYWTLFDPIGWDALRRLLSCEWFHRRWTIQEAVIPQEATVLCGPDVMTMTDMFRGIDIAVPALLARPKEIKVLKFANTGSVRPLLVLKELKKLYNGKKNQLQLLWLLEHLRFTRSTLAHDQIYALLGLCHHQEMAGNPIRYDLRPEDAYKACTVTHARIHQNLEFLGLCTPIQRSDSSSGPAEQQVVHSVVGPSWVPNWYSKNLRRCLGLGIVDQDSNFFNASKEIAANISLTDDELTVSGILVDRIHLLGGLPSPDRTSELSDPDSRLFQDYINFWNVFGDPPPYEDARSRVDTFARTVSLLGIYLDPQPLPEDVPAMFYRWCRQSNLCKKLEGCGLTSEVIEHGSLHKRFMRMKRLMSWEPLITVQGYMGFAREQAEAGDEIWIIGGCSVPILLCRTTDNPPRYTVKGEIFLDGFMFGEAESRTFLEQGSARPITLI
ncbi:hypothetical protein NUW58_g4773 [Xylaria curta]|uniref:Uncharacterized protein n=1 Tax=Xylaria curta TaxID=42375 RepID=A0ACC1P680_9PEZI|nr:hypothetical protein NUW58_g4773 [Xylaria curta]